MAAEPAPEGLVQAEAVAPEGEELAAEVSRVAAQELERLVGFGEEEGALDVAVVVVAGLEAQG